MGPIRSPRTVRNRLNLVFALAAVAALTAAAPAQSPPDPVADPATQFISGRARFTVISDRTLRIEWSPTRTFEDRASYFAINRRHSTPPEVYVDEQPDRIDMRLMFFQVRYTDDGNPPSAANLEVLINNGDRWVRWEPGTPAPENLGGTRRTLDGVSGAAPLEPGILTRSGFTFIDDSGKLVFDNGSPAWLTPRSEPDARDWYLIAYQKNYTEALLEFINLSGPIPLPPRYAFGAWWSRYWDYTDGELRDLVAQFRAHDVPLDVLVIDMDWHLPGWTGYTWDPENFPDPKAFLDWCHAQGLRVPLNLHPADGVRPHEQAFPDVCRELGLNPETTAHIPFDCTDREYMCAYFKHLHHPLEAQGVDFWWLDWQQGTHTRTSGLDPLPWLNHLHFEDLRTNPARKGRRPLIFSRWGGLGNHRYQVGFSGDTFCDWESLAFQPYFTATAGNVGYAYWSHDIGGHQPGPVEPELYARWVQFGALSPILRVHSTRTPLAERRIWEFPDEFFAAMKQAWRFRYELIPYLYSAARTCHDLGLPLCRPLYYAFPDEPAAYEYTNSYMLGDQLLVAPIVAPRSTETRCATANVWIPPGEWVHWYTGQRWTGPQEVRLPTPLDQIPLFAKAGAIIPTAAVKNSTNDPADPLTFHVFPGPPQIVQLYEDDGISTGYQRGEAGWTQVQTFEFGNTLGVTIDRTYGEYAGMPQSRETIIALHGVTRPSGVRLASANVSEATASDAASTPHWQYDAETFTLNIHLGRRQCDQQHVVQVDFLPRPAALTAIRSGLAEQLRVVREWSEALGANAPASLQEFRNLAARLPAGADDSAATLNDTLMRAVQDAANADATLPRRGEFIARALGVAAEFIPSDNAVAPLTLAAGVGSGLLPGAAMDVTITSSAGEQFGSGRVEPGGSVKFGIDGSSFLGDGIQPPQTRTLVAKLSLPMPAGPAIELNVSREVLPSINGWWLAGPFDAADAPRLDAEFAGRTTVDPAETWTGKDGAPAKWVRALRPVQSGTDLTRDFFVALPKWFGTHPHNACAYAIAYVDSPSARRARLLIGSDDGNRVWLNGKEVHAKSVGRPYAPRQDSADVELAAGRNVIVVRIDQQTGDWGFSVAVTDEAGRGLPGLTCELP
jgi:alpha-glucosidase (family GH31 glycosyl hydrolase)